MKVIYGSRYIIFPFVIFFILVTFLNLISVQEKGPHGGKLQKADNYFIEMKSTENDLMVYLLDKKLKTVSNKGISGDVRFYMADKSDISVGLKPTMEDAFMAEEVPGFIACKITFNIYGKSVAVKFENEKLFAKK